MLGAKRPLRASSSTTHTPHTQPHARARARARAHTRAHIHTKPHARTHAHTHQTARTHARTQPCSRARALASGGNDHSLTAVCACPQLPPIMVQKVVPMCMKQYERIFDTTRVPGLECDTLVHHMDDPQRYVAVNCRSVPLRVSASVAFFLESLPVSLFFFLWRF